MNEVADTAEAYRRAIAAGDSRAWSDLGLLLSAQPGREREAEDAYREAVAAGDEAAWNGVGLMLAGQPGREREAESAFRRAIAADNPMASDNGASGPRSSASTIWSPREVTTLDSGTPSRSGPRAGSDPSRAGRGRWRSRARSGTSTAPAHSLAARVQRSRERQR